MLMAFQIMLFFSVSREIAFYAMACC